MNNSTRKVLLIGIIFIIMLMIMILAILLSYMIKNNQESSNNSSLNTISNTLQDVNNVTGSSNSVINANLEDNLAFILNKYNCEFIKLKSNKLYLKFGEGLFDSNNQSNLSYFQGIVDKIGDYFGDEEFYMIDEDQDINIYVEYEDKRHVISLINGYEDFYDRVDGKQYNLIDNVTMVDSELIPYSTDNSSLLVQLSLNSFKFSAIQNYLGECTKSENGYDYYLDNTVKVRVSEKGNKVANIVFLEGYEGEFISNIKVGDSLTDIAKNYPDYFAGGTQKGYLAYRGNDFYYFFYADQISVYWYNIEPQYELRDIIMEYADSQDLKAMYLALLACQIPCETLEYNAENGTLKACISYYGVDIDINNEIGSKGITLYSNFTYNDEIKEYVKTGKISSDVQTDLIEKVEKIRVEGN